MEMTDRRDRYGSSIKYFVFLAVALTIPYLLPTNCWPVSEPIQKHSPVKSRRVDGEILVRFKTGVGQAAAGAILSRYGFTSIKRYKRVSNLYHVRIPSVLTADAAIDLLQSDPDVEYAEPNYLMEGDSACSSSPCTPNDTLYSDPGNWGFANIGAPQAWTVTTGDSSLVVAVIDSGIDYNHPDLANNKWTNQAEASGTPAFYGYNAVADIGSGGLCPPPASSFPIDDDTSVLGHGTRLAGIIGAVGNNSTGIAGVNWNVKLMPIKVRCEPDRQSNLALFIAGMDYMLTEKQAGVNIRVANMSVGVSTYSQSLQNILDAARDAGILLVASAGNSSTNLDLDSTDFHSYPYDNVLFVAATDQTNALAGFSDYGQVDIHLAAPGAGILSTVRSVYTPLYQTDDGTSYSTPFVTGVAALLSAYDPTISYTGLKAHIISATTREDALVGKVASGGRLNVADVFSAPITDLRPAGYQLARIEVNHKYYTDSSFTITSIPQGFDRLWWVRTKNADNANTDANHINIGLGRDATVYVAYDPRAISIPDWLSSGHGWTDTGLSIGVSDSGAGSLRIYGKPFSSGMVVLGGNQAAGYVGPTSGSSSNYVVLISLTGDTPPSTPGNLQATAVSLSAINLSWTASTDYTGVAGYTVYRGAVPVATTPTTGYTDTGLTASTIYTYKVSAFDSAGDVSPLSDPASAMTFSDTTPPSVPTNVQAAVISFSQIDLSWTASTDNVGVAGYTVYRGGVQVATTPTTGYTDSRLTASTMYTYKVRAFDSAGNVSPLSDPVSAVTLTLPLDTTPPSVPTNVQAAVISFSQIDLSWTASTDNVGVAGYTVYRGGVQVATTPTTGYTDSGLTASTMYTYEVSAYDTTGNVSPLSAPVSATTGTGLQSTANNPPFAPTLVYPTDGQTGLGTTVTFQWKTSADPDGDTVTYHLYYCPDKNFIGCNPVDVALLEPKNSYYAGMGGSAVLLVFGSICARGLKRRKALALFLIGVIIVIGGVLSSCGGGGGTQSTDEKSYTTTGLTAGTTYFWKVVADDGKGGTTASAVWSFSTQ